MPRDLPDVAVLVQPVGPLAVPEHEELLFADPGKESPPLPVVSEALHVASVDRRDNRDILACRWRYLCLSVGPAVEVPP